ncbi:hypothetical protein H0H93_009998 [Arthromyces matolae]|nr:hypothetical protein H0H93_009998 [Arthromyces matolae]
MTISSEYGTQSTLVAREYNYDELIEPFNRTNHPLGSVQASILKSDLENRAKKLLALDHEILRLQLTIDSSLKRLQGLNQTRLEDQKAHDLRQYWFSSVRVLPTDVLMTILLYAASAHLDSSSSPLKLSQVCSSWRTAAQDCPSLWNRLAVDLWSPKTSPSGESLDLTTLFGFWYGRSGTTSSLSMSASVTTELKPEAFRDFDTAVGRWGSRIGHLTLIIRTSRDGYNLYGLKIFDNFFAMPRGSFSNLEYLCLIDYTREYEDLLQDLPTITVFDQSPLLREVILRLPYAFYPITRIQLPWSQLRRLTIGEYIGFRNWVVMFFQCRNLVSAVFHGVRSPFDGDDVLFNFDEPVTFPELEIFYVHFEHSPSQDHIILNLLLSKICLPAVKYLRLMGDLHTSMIHRQISFTSLSTFSSGVYPSLRELTLVRTAIEMADLLSILSACPLLKSLALFLDSPPKSVLESLTLQHTPASAQASWVKHLERFTFTFHTPDVERNPEIDNIATAFADLIVSWAPTSELPRDRVLRFTFVMYDDSHRFGTRRDFLATEKRVKDIIHGVLEREILDKDLKIEHRVDIVKNGFDMFPIFDMEDVTAEDFFPRHRRG